LVIGNWRLGFGSGPVHDRRARRVTDRFTLARTPGEMKQGLKRALSHVFWIGGSPCAGKSSIAKILVDKYKLQYYECDHQFGKHQARVVPDRRPAFHQLSRMSWDEIWMRPVPVQVAAEFDIYREEFEMIVEDLLALPGSPPILAEGAALLPDCVVEVLMNRRQAIWITPTEGFQRTHYPRRPWIQEILRQCSEPQQAFQNWMDRDVAFAKQVAGRAAELGLALIKVDGMMTITETAAIAANFFELH